MPVAPAFWDRPPGLAAGLLAPFAELWGAAGRLKETLARPYRSPLPVLCVGNLVAGGAGKTPVALSLATRLLAGGIGVHALLRGYGGRLKGPVRVDPRRHAAAAVGDEALLYARIMPSWVARDRAEGARAALAAGAEAILLDDGLQNAAIVKTHSLLVVDAAYGFGNGRVIPAGPLRESLKRGLGRAAAAVLIGEGPAPVELLPSLPIVRARLEPVGGERFAGRAVFAFAGIGRPQKFFATLDALGAKLVDKRAFPDHHLYRPREIESLLRAAREAGAALVTTAKDIVRVPPPLSGGIEVLEVEIVWEDPAALEHQLEPMLRASGGDGSRSRG
jgi:tetraacyldisaccharide 4'-kinase